MDSMTEPAGSNSVNRATATGRRRSGRPRRARRLGAVAVATVSFLGAASAGTTALADHDRVACVDVNLVFARGSGQGLAGGEANKFFSAIGDRLDSADITVNAYEVGTEAHGGATYPAVGVGLDSVEAIRNAIEADASWTGFLGGEYNSSVRQGVTEMSSYLASRAAKCPDELFVVGGYSQGAQVMGDAVTALDRAVRDRIAYAAMFGDPKLYLPEGRGIFPPACRGGELSPWRRGTVGCFTDNGVLEARVPYVPTDMADRTGSWCDRDDPICTDNLFDTFGSTHGNYDDDGNGIDEAAREAAAAVAGRLADRGTGVNTSILLIGTGTTGLDVAFVIDTTGSMAGRIDAARQSANELATAITGRRGRVALTEYRDAGDSFVAAVRSPLNNDIAVFENALAPLVADGGGDTPEALLTALMETFNTLDWRPGATKAAVVLTDTGYHDPDVANGFTLGDVTARALEIDPVNVYPVVPAEVAGEYAALAEQTAGQVIVDDGDTQQALLAAITEIQARPTALLAIDEYWAAPGDEVTFDASPSYDPDSELTSFEWDFDGDGAIDQTSATPVVRHTYPSAFDGLAEVRVHSADGGVANAIATMHINETGLATLQPASPTDLAATVVETGPKERTIGLSWAAPTSGGAVAGYRIYRNDGQLIGQVSADELATEVTNVPPEEVSLAVAAVNKYGTSAPASVTVPAATGSSPTGHQPESGINPTPETPETPETPAPTYDPTSTHTAAPVPGSGREDGDGHLSLTGVNIAGPLVAASVLIGLGTLLTIAARRKRWHEGTRDLS